MKFTLPFILKGEYNIPKSTIRKNRTGNYIVSLPDEERPFFIETVFDESEQIGDELDEILYELEYFFSQTLEEDIQNTIPGASIELSTDFDELVQTPKILDTGSAVISFLIKGHIILFLSLKTPLQTSQYEIINEFLTVATIHGNQILNDFTLRELSNLPNWKHLSIQLTYEDPLKEATKANSLARQQYRAITGLETLPENVTRKIGSYLTGPLNNSALRSRPLPKGLTKEVLEQSTYERQQRGGRTRKQKKTHKHSCKSRSRR